MDKKDILQDQERAIRAHRKIKSAMAQLLGMKHMDSEQAKVLRQLYAIEDVLHQYATDVYIG